MRLAHPCALLVALLIGLPAITAAGPAPIYDSRSAFEALKQLAGDWDVLSERANMNHSRARYRVTAGGTVVEEALFFGQPQEMTTMYYLEKGTLVLHHYCVLGNQPEMKFAAGTDPGVISFQFRDTGAINLRRDDHMHAVEFRTESPDRVAVRWERYGGGVRQEDVKFVLTRLKK